MYPTPTGIILSHEEMPMNHIDELDKIKQLSTEELQELD